MSILKRIISKCLQHYRRQRLRLCGEHVRIAKRCRLQGNIYFGGNIVVGEGALFVSSIANIYIHDYVVFGPNVTIYSGDHPVDIIGKHIIEITDKEKIGNNSTSPYDHNVVIEAGCWIGTGAIILKGVTIGKGSVIGAGAVVTKDVPPYTIYVGVPSAQTRPRFNEEQIIQHERQLRERGLPIQ